MGKLESLDSVLNGSGWMLALVAIPGLIAAILKLVRDGAEIHHSLFTKRPLERLSHLNDAARADSPIAPFLAKLKDAELFRLATKLHVPPAHADLLMKVFATGLFSIGEIRMLARFLHPAAEERIRVSVDWLDRISAWLAITAIGFVSLYLGWGIWMFSFVPSYDTLVTAIAIALVWLVALFFFRGDIRAYLATRRARDKLRAAGLLEAQ